MDWTRQDKLYTPPRRLTLENEICANEKEKEEEAVF